MEDYSENTEYSGVLTKLRPENKHLLAMGVFGLITIFLWAVPLGTYVLYPFTILGTWFHEMGHGMAALIMGGNLLKLQLFPNGSGLAMHSGPYFLGDIGRALIAGAGPVGPAIAGFFLMVASKRMSTTKFALFSLAVLLLISTFFWIRPLIGFGALMTLLLSIGIFYIGMKASEKWKVLSLQFIAIQAFASTYLSTGYLFSQSGEIEGSSYLSDTAHIAEHLLLPHWFWAFLILIISLFLVIKSIKIVIKD